MEKVLSTLIDFLSCSKPKINREFEAAIDITQSPLEIKEPQVPAKVKPSKDLLFLQPDSCFVKFRVDLHLLTFVGNLFPNSQVFSPTFTNNELRLVTDGVKANKLNHCKIEGNACDYEYSVMFNDRLGSFQIKALANSDSLTCKLNKFKILKLPVKMRIASFFLTLSSKRTKLSVVIERTNEEKQVFCFEENKKFTVGRKNSDVNLNEKKVSVNQLKIKYLGCNRVVIENDGSKNGTYLVVGCDYMPLETGDELHFLEKYCIVEAVVSNRMY